MPLEQVVITEQRQRHAGSTSTTVRIDNYDDYEENHLNDSSFTFITKEPWFLGVMDSRFVQSITSLTRSLVSVLLTSVTLGYCWSRCYNSSVVCSHPWLAGSTTRFTGYLKGIITGVSTDAVNGNSTIDVKIVSRVSYELVQRPNSTTNSKPPHSPSSAWTEFLSSITLVLTLVTEQFRWSQLNKTGTNNRHLV